MKGNAPVMDQPGPKPCVLLADKGYDGDFILADLEARSVAAVIPTKRNRKVQPVIDGYLRAAKPRRTLLLRAETQSAAGDAIRQDGR